MVTFGPKMPSMSAPLPLPGVTPAEEIRGIAHPIERAIALVGLARLARELGRTHQAIRKWQLLGRLPRTEWTGETHYAKTIARLTDNVVTVEMLLEPWPAWARPDKQASETV